ncbi:MAG: hypothetical protein OEU09_00955 [Rhodospirillales bacterium]|nr:hypothetical protein [Rhodospirillales bacterium]MDH3792957.1 hypothetical protein [Rhodospirillales bacterium]MDH3909831.1 hypothetical protein [Rhodospirillales bacterium]MDH3917758.1 hypothetical protein [Rhodospirillales bacterium]MDH3966696.1 hypothetical protein [Rhodospirillales bacterium]
MLNTLFARFTRTGEPEADRRRETRNATPGGTVEIDGRAYPIVNWSYSGFLAESYAGDRKAGDRVDITFTVEPGDGRAFAFACKAMMVRVDPEARKLVGAFVEMDAATRAKLSRYFD